MLLLAAGISGSSGWPPLCKSTLKTGREDMRPKAVCKRRTRDKLQSQQASDKHKVVEERDSEAYTDSKMNHGYCRLIAAYFWIRHRARRNMEEGHEVALQCFGFGRVHSPQHEGRMRKSKGPC